MSIKEGEYEINGIKGEIKNPLEKVLRLHQIAGGFITEKIPNKDLLTAEKNPFIVNTRSIPGINPKLREVEAIANETNESIVIWCAYKSEIYALRKFLKENYGDNQVVEIHGDIKEENRHENCQLFQAGQARFMIGNAATGGMGIELQRATIMIYYSNTRKYEDRRQSEDRIHRMGQLKSTLYIDLIAVGTVDRLYKRCLDNKMDVDEYIRGLLRNNTSINNELCM